VAAGSGRVLTVPAMSDLAVSLYLPGTVPISTLHDVGLQTSYVSSPGDFTGSPGMPVQRNISWSTAPGR
jgi:hypothetical protein